MSAPDWSAIATRFQAAAAKLTPDVRPLPTLEEFARFLFDRDGSDVAEAAHAQRRLLIEYAAIWADYEGIPRGKAVQQAHELADEAHMTGAERLAEERR